jgi:ABC-type branched-subunit amino acid transport system substrate-binding protein
MSHGGREKHKAPGHGALAGLRRALLSVLLFLLLFSAACAHPGDAAPVVKLGLIAPFEGAGRPLGYAVLPVIKDVLAQANAGGDLGRYRVALVALDDSLDAGTAARQAKALALDPSVLAVIGPFTAETATSVQSVLAPASVPFVPVISVAPTDEDYSEEISAAREAANAVLQALAADIAGSGRPDRSGLAAELASP